MSLAGCPSGGNGDAGADEAPIEYDSDASVAFEEPSDGATAANGVTVSMTAENFTIEESGEVNDNAGHFHVIVDEEPSPKWRWASSFGIVSPVSTGPSSTMTWK